MIRFNTAWCQDETTERRSSQSYTSRDSQEVRLFGMKMWENKRRHGFHPPSTESHEIPGCAEQLRVIRTLSFPALDLVTHWFCEGLDPLCFSGGAGDMLTAEHMLDYKTSLSWWFISQIGPLPESQTGSTSEPVGEQMQSQVEDVQFRLGRLRINLCLRTMSNLASSFSSFSPSWIFIFLSLNILSVFNLV